MSEPSSADRDPFEVVAEAFLARFRSGQRPSIDEYAARQPELADQIRELLPALVMVEQDLTIDRDPAPTGPRPPLAPFRERRLGDYRILREVGRGGMGVVYEAEQVSLGRRVALKVLPGHHSGDGLGLERFRREAKAAARLHHTNIVPVFEVGSDGDVAYYAMQCIQGQGLDQVIDELTRLRDREPGPGRAKSPGPTEAVAATDMVGPPVGRIAESLLLGRIAAEASAPIPDPSTADPEVTERIDRDATRSPGLALASRGPERPLAGATSGSRALLPGGSEVSTTYLSGRRATFFRSVAGIGRQAAQGLAYAHAGGIVHRDIKPSNLLLDHAGVVWIADFGLAKADDDGLTQSGDILGTLRYMAPERFRGAGDARADIYALGMTLYELLTLRPAYESADRLKLIERIKNEEPARPRLIDPRIPRDLETIVLKAMDKLPERRYATAEALSEDLRRFLADEPIKARQIGASERYWRWARRNPVVATLGGVLSAVLVMATIGSLLTAARFADLAERQGNSATAERSARIDADLARTTADEARKAAETSRTAALAETYRAMLSEVKALRSGHQLGWREEALANLARLAVMPTPRRDLVELRDEAAASIGEFDVVEVARLEGLRGSAWSLDFSPDSRSLVAATMNGDLHLYDVARRRHSWQVADPRGEQSPTGWPRPADPRCHVQFLHDGSLARTTWSHRVEFLDPSGGPSARPSIEGGQAQAVNLKVDRGGRWLAIGWNDGRIDLHDADTLALRRSCRGNPDIFALSPDGNWLAFAGPDKSVQVTPTDREVAPITVGRAHRAITSVTFSPDGTTLACSSWDMTTTLWDVNRREERVTLRGHKEKATDVAFSPDGDWVATTSHDYTARLWDARTGQTLAVLPARYFAQSVKFSPDGQYLAIAVTNRTASLHRIQGRRERRWLAGHAFGAFGVAFHPTRPLLASGADDHDAVLWDVETARPVRRWTHESGLDGVAFSPDGSILACGGVDALGDVKRSEIRLWNTDTGSSIRALPGHAAGVLALAFDGTGRRLATGDKGGVLILWDAATGRPLRREVVGPSPIRSIAFLDEGRRLVTSATDGPIVVYDLGGSGPPRRVVVPGGARRFVVDRTRNDLIVAGSGNVLTRFSLGDFAPGQRLSKGHDGVIESLAIAPGGRLLATGGDDRRIILRDATTFEPLATLPIWTGRVRDLAFDPSGRWLAIAGADSDVGLWDLGLVHDELAALGLAWDQAPPSVSSAGTFVRDGERLRPSVPIIWPGNVDATEFAKVQRLVESGVSAFHQGRFADAAADLQRASERLRALRQSRPDDEVLARMHSIGLGFLAGSLRDSKRPIEALARAREAVAVYESIRRPISLDLYNLACDYALVSALDVRGSPEEREKLGARAVGCLRGAIAGDAARFLPASAADRDLDPLRDRADFRGMMADAIFPRDPFTQPSPLAWIGSLSTGEKRELDGLTGEVAREPSSFQTRRARGGFFARRGAWPAAAADYRMALDLNPPSKWDDSSFDNHFALESAVVLLQAGDVDGYRRLARTMLDRFGESNIASIADATAKVNSLLRPPEQDLGRLGRVAQQAVDAGRGDGILPWCLLVRGMAAYRAGDFAGAVEWLDKAGASSPGPDHRAATLSYQAMASSRLGRAETARAFLSEAGGLTASRVARKDVGGGWHDLWIAELARRQAGALINSTQPQTTGPVGP